MLNSYQGSGCSQQEIIIRPQNHPLQCLVYTKDVPLQQVFKL